MHRLRCDSWPTLSLWLGLWACALSLTVGCQFLSPKSAAETAGQPGRNLLTTLKPAKDAIQYEVLLIDRRADDPLIGAQLWRGIDEVGAVPIETREILRRNGILVGHVAAKPPTPMLKLLGVVSEIDGMPFGVEGAPQPKVTGQRYSVRSGAEAEIQVSELQPESTVTIVDHGETRVSKFEQVRFVFRLKPMRLQDGWVHFEFLPEIHHGEMQLRYVPSDEFGWTTTSSQQINACHSQKFGVRLNVGESVLVSSLSDAEGTLGTNFFKRDRQGELRQRLLIVRLLSMGRPNKPFD